jgi:hypothetical protein
MSFEDYRNESLRSISSFLSMRNVFIIKYRRSAPSSIHRPELWFPITNTKTNLSTDMKSWSRNSIYYYSPVPIVRSVRAMACPIPDCNFPGPKFPHFVPRVLISRRTNGPTELQPVVYRLKLAPYLVHTLIPCTQRYFLLSWLRLRLNTVFVAALH